MTVTTATAYSRYHPPPLSKHAEVHIMGRWTQYDEDSERLPTGMKRIGYDADTRIYTFQDENGVLYESEPGNAFGILRPVVRDYGRDIQKARPNAFEPSRNSTSHHSRSTSTPASNLRSFQDFLPPTAITHQPNSPPSRNDDSHLPDVFSKIRSMTSVVSRLQSPNRPPQGSGRYQHIKSPSLPVSSLSDLYQSERVPPSQLQTASVVPSKKNREYRMPRKEVEEEELKKRLSRSKTSVTRSKAIAPSSSAHGSKSPASFNSSLSGLGRFSPPPQIGPPVPPKRSRDYTLSRKGIEEDEMRKGLLRSKTSVTRSSAVAPSSSSSSSSFAPKSKYRPPVYRSPSISPPPSSSLPKRTTSQASRISSVSTTSTITPMKTT